MRPCDLFSTTLVLAVGLSIFAAPVMAQPTYYNFESGQVRPLALSPDGKFLFAVNTPDSRLEIFDLDTLTKLSSVQVGLEPVAVAARTNTEVWVVNHLSDSVSIVDLSLDTPRVVRTLLVGDEPKDIVFAGPGGNRAFITAAHRGQNAGDGRSSGDGLFTDLNRDIARSEWWKSGIGRADIYVFDANNLGTSLEGDRLTRISLFGDRPRALAVSPDGGTVYAAVFHSGNQTTTVTETLVCNTSGSGVAPTEGPCTVSGMSIPGGVPQPVVNHEGIRAPETGLIVGWDGSKWTDELDRNWNDVVHFDLPDLDVFAIDANADPPVEIDNWAGVGTTLYNLAVNPRSGKIYVTNTDANNRVRFEGPGTYVKTTSGPTKPEGEPASVRGNIVKARITVLDGASVAPHHLNPHVDYGTAPQEFTAGKSMYDSLATPLGMAFSSDGSTVYMAAFGSGKIGVIDTADLESGSFAPDEADHIELTGGGPTGILLDEARNQAYVMTRFNNAVSVISLASGTESSSLSLYSPEPQSIIEGRPFQYDALLTSSNGESSCSSCHIFSDVDDLAWDLGNPDADVIANNNRFVGRGEDGRPRGNIRPLHPNKGPMTTQTYRGLARSGPQHWRGDRSGANDSVSPPGTYDDHEEAFRQFNAAIEALNGRDTQLEAADMDKFVQFGVSITSPPNPIRKLDNQLRTEPNDRDELAGENLFFNGNSDGGTCNRCHTIDPAQGFFGTNMQSTDPGEPQSFKMPHFRNQYQKVGMFGQANAPRFPAPPAEGEPISPRASAGRSETRESGCNTDFSSHQGDQIRGFGDLHDGSVESTIRLITGTTFTRLTNAQRCDIAAFVLASPTTVAPMVGQQVTLTSTSGEDTDARIDLMLARADARFVLVDHPTATECDVVVKGYVGGMPRGYLRAASGTFLSDRADEPALDEDTLRELATPPGQELTFTCAPPGTGTRMGIDRDLDGALDGDELDAGTDPADAASRPGA